MDAADYLWHPSFRTIPVQLSFYGQAYNHRVLNFLFQLLAIYLFAATPWFAGWIANDGKWQDVGIPIVGSIFLFVVLMFLIFFFAYSPFRPISIALF
jgi:hypothetical protein